MQGNLQTAPADLLLCKWNFSANAGESAPGAHAATTGGRCRLERSAGVETLHQMTTSHF